LTREIPLTRGKVALVDDEDFEWLSQWKWQCTRDGYAASNRITGDGKKTYMHRMIMSSNPGEIVDHADRNRLNNQRSNLRIGTFSTNSANGKVFRNSTSGYRGVNVAKNRWKGALTVNGQSHHLGYFDDKDDAARMYNFWAADAFGEFASLNAVGGVSRTLVCQG
jgi:hypothetical protein